MHLLIVQEFKNVKQTLWINQINVYKQAQKERRSATTVATFKAGFLIARINKHVFLFVRAASISSRQYLPHFFFFYFTLS